MLEGTIVISPRAADNMSACVNNYGLSNNKIVGWQRRRGAFLDLVNRKNIEAINCGCGILTFCLNLNILSI